ncbi:hypothetical protein E4U55_003175 [Claviceps digitariae]|nr:hypothetical protein E4U55_003175 [Claviceps digitariae]
MASVARQPFAPLDGARLQSLTSFKNRQNNAVPHFNNIKRKADLLDAENDFENVDPCLSKRSKGAFGTPIKDMMKPSAYVLTKAAGTTPCTPSANVGALFNHVKAATAPRHTLQPRSPLHKITTNAAKSSPLTAPAGRSPTRATRSGLLSRQTTASGNYARVDPPSFGLDRKASSSFSLNTALKGTISGGSSRPRSNALFRASRSISAALAEPAAKASWFFDIHEDTPEEEMTNLLQHSTYILDISSDEENELRERRERAEGRDKENIPPSGYTPQTSPRRSVKASAHIDGMVVETERVVLAEMKMDDLAAISGDANSIVIIPGDDVDEESTEATSETTRTNSEPETEAAVLEPIEGTGESFDLWESGSVKDDSGLAAIES